MAESILTDAESVLNPRIWKELHARHKAQNDFLSVKTLTVILNGVEELAEARSLPDSPIQVSAMHLSGFRSLFEAFNNPRLIKQVGVLYLQEFSLPEVALDHLELALQLSPGQKDKQIEMLREAAIKRISRSADQEIHTMVDQPLRQKPVVSTVVKKTGRLTLSLAKEQLSGAVNRLTLSVKAVPAEQTPRPPDPTLPIAKAAALLLERQWQEALPHLDAAQGPTTSTLVLQKLYTQAGLMALAEGDFDAALSACLKARDVLAIKADPWFNVGIIYQKLGRLDEALACFVQAQQLEPHNPEVWCNLSSVHFERGVYNEAEKAARKALDLSAQNARAWDALAAALAAVDRLTEAADACAHALEQDPHLSSAWFKKGTLEFHQDNLSEAWKAFLQAQSNPEFLPFALYYLAMIDARHGKFEQAQAKLSNARAMVPSSDLLLTVLREMALSFTQRDEFAQALKFYTEAIALQPSDFTSWLGLGTVHHHQGRRDDARRAYLQASNLQSTHSGPWHNLGLLAAEENNHAEAQSYFEKEVRLSPDNPKAWYDLGLSYQNQGKQEESRQAFAQVEKRIREPIGATGDLLAGLKIVRRMHLKKRVLKVK